MFIVQIYVFVYALLGLKSAPPSHHMSHHNMLILEKEFMAVMGLSNLIQCQSKFDQTTLTQSDLYRLEVLTS